MSRTRRLLVGSFALLLALAVMAVSAAACGGGGGKEPTTLTTQLSGENKEGTEITVLEGTKVTDKATLSGKNVSKATGKVKYDVYSEKVCKTLVTAAGEGTVSGESVTASKEEELEAGKTYYWQAVYEGNESNSASTSSCGREVLTVAGPVWMQCIQFHEGTENETCATESTGDFEWVEVVAPVSTSSEGTLKLVDKKGGPSKEELAIECTVRGVGTVGAEAGGEVTEAKATGCKTVAGSCETPSAQAVNLPWQSELVQSSGERRDNIKAATKAPGWKITCAKTEDTCEGATSTKITDNKNIVEETFGAGSAKETCTLGGVEAGEISGVDKVTASEERITGINAQPRPAFVYWASGTALGRGTILRTSDEAGGLPVRTGTGTDEFEIYNRTAGQLADCTMSDAGRIWNPDGMSGLASLSSFETRAGTRCTSPGRICAAPRITGRNVARWRFTMAASRDGRSAFINVRNMELEVECGVGEVEIYREGIFLIFLKVANGGGIGEAECAAPTHTTYMEFFRAPRLVPERVRGVGELNGNDCIWGEARNELIEVVIVPRR